MSARDNADRVGEDPAVTVTIDGVSVPVPIMRFGALKRAWPALRRLMALEDGIDQTAAAIEIVAAALNRVRPDLSAATIEESLSIGEAAALVSRIPTLLEASGLVSMGEAKPGP